MKKLLVLTLALVMTLSFGYVTLASTMGIGASEGAVSVEVGAYVEPSDYDDNTYVSGFYGLNDKTLLSLGYETDSKNIDLGVRYAFAEKMAVTLNYYLQDAEGLDDVATVGFRYKTSVNDTLALVGALKYKNSDPDAKIDVIGQAEYSFTDKVVGTLQFDYFKIDDENGTDITVGVETYPTEKVCAYLDYTIPEEGDNTAYLAVSYSF